MNKEPIYISQLRRLLNENKITIQDCAAQCGVSTATLSRILNNKIPLSNKVLLKLADFLVVSPDYILGNTDNPQPALTDFPKVSIENDKTIRKYFLYIMRTCNTTVREKVIIGNKEYCRIFSAQFFTEDANSFTEDELSDIIHLSPGTIHHSFEIARENHPGVFMSPWEFDNYIYTLLNSINLCCDTLFRMTSRTYMPRTSSLEQIIENHNKMIEEKQKE